AAAPRASAGGGGDRCPATEARRVGGQSAPLLPGRRRRCTAPWLRPLPASGRGVGAGPRAPANGQAVTRSTRVPAAEGARVGFTCRARPCGCSGNPERACASYSGLRARFRMYGRRWEPEKPRLARPHRSQPPPSPTRSCAPRAAGALLARAQAHATGHRAELLRSDRCGCFACGAIFLPTRIVKWLGDGATTRCPLCWSATVIGSASGLPISAELLAMLQRYRR